MSAVTPSAPLNPAAPYQESYQSASVVPRSSATSLPTQQYEPPPPYTQSPVPQAGYPQGYGGGYSQGAIYPRDPQQPGFYAGEAQHPGFYSSQGQQPPYCPAGYAYNPHPPPTEKTIIYVDDSARREQERKEDCCQMGLMAACWTALCCCLFND